MILDKFYRLNSITNTKDDVEDKDEDHEAEEIEFPELSKINNVNI